MPEAPVRTPTRTRPEPVTEPSPLRRYKPGEICPDQGDEVVRRLAP